MNDSGSHVASCDHSYIFILPNFTSRGFLKTCHFIICIPKACSTQIHNCERKKIKASFDWLNFFTPLYEIKRGDDNVYALSPTIKKPAGGWETKL
jgi:hypothetical protein